MIYKNQLKIESPCIIAVYHDEMLPVLDFMKNKNAVFITSKHHVGASLANVLKSWGYKIIYGSPGGRGKEAIEELIEEIKKGKTAIITPDGSRGPRHKMKAGAIIIAKKANVPLYLVSPNYRGIRIKSSWDKFLYPYPFSKVMFKYVKMEIDPALNREETNHKIIEAGKLLENLSNHFEEGRTSEPRD
ncbi:MAG: DUF374 domain-containing protein [Candidatus Marinimicrobia bacterium]|nr:DUF374 domain-containing protein [Candidatus Neomarinimicrobiota bacterium]